MKKFISILIIIATIGMFTGCDTEEVAETWDGNENVITQNIITEDVIYEDVITENVITQNIIG